VEELGAAWALEKEQSSVLEKEPVMEREMAKLKADTRVTKSVHWMEAAKANCSATAWGVELERSSGKKMVQVMEEERGSVLVLELVSMKEREKESKSDATLELHSVEMKAIALEWKLARALASHSASPRAPPRARETAVESGLKMARAWGRASARSRAPEKESAWAIAKA